MRHELVVTKLSGQESILVVAVESVVSPECYTEIAMFAPALRAVVGNMACRAWYDDASHELVIQRDMGAPPRHR